MRPRTCEHRLAGGRARRWWDAVRRGHARHVCDRVRSFQHAHRGRHRCGCGVMWA